ncbi:hypothetical protein GIB67_012946 [Kingdonia uniflora]|uniref:BACK domain-containing protein n=1 Tax=Kingdonia uniflora TaxID=39325 RepID=A0A7J7NFN2_9MAGN|nr:hypothetical protein GIB67_012946 [Kingdonia uniflora]
MVIKWRELERENNSISEDDLEEIIDYESIGCRLIEGSSYFRGLVAGNFSESYLDCISIKWNPEIFISIIKSIYGCTLDVTPGNFVPLLEGALFFGVETLLLECKAWLSKATSASGISFMLPLDAICEIWSFGLEHAIDFVPELCVMHLARNFMRAISCSSFVNIQYNLLVHCVEHPDLTVDSEKHLAEALLAWLHKNGGLPECSTENKSNRSDILKKVRVSLLLLRFAAGNGEFDSIRIRLTDYTERIDLSGCPQIAPALLLLSMLPCSYNMDYSSSKRIKKFLIKLESLDVHQSPISENVFPTLSFQAVREVDVSNCPGIHLESFIKYLCLSFPSLRTLRASYCSKFRMVALFHLLQNCPLINELHLTADISPANPTKVSTLSTSFDEYHVASRPMFNDSILSSNITKIVLEGRNDITDSDLINISKFCGSLSYLDLKGCTSVTDVGLSKLIYECVNLQSLVVSDTYFGRQSVIALCSDFSHLDGFPGMPNDLKQSSSLAFKLLELQIGDCKNVDGTSLSQLMSHTCMLKCLSLRDTPIADAAFLKFLGSSLERLDVSETVVSSTALAHIIRRNPGLKLLNLSGCRNMCHLESLESYSGCSKGGKLFFDIGRTCILEDAAFGWGFSSFSLEDMEPAIKSLRSITLSLGASLSQYALTLLPRISPLLESVVLNFQVISDSIVKNIVESLPNLQILALCYCLGNLSSISIHLSMPKLRKLKLERVTPWLTNDDLIILTQKCTSLTQLSLSGCILLNSESQQIISRGWPDLVSIHLEECGEVTSYGVSSLFDCWGIEDLLLRHNGRGIQRNFIVDAASKMPMLRKMALDLCDASEGGFDTPNFDERSFLSIVTLARCKRQRCAFNLSNSDACRSVHKDSIVLEWNTKGFRTTIVEERVS